MLKTPSISNIDVPRSKNQKSGIFSSFRSKRSPSKEDLKQKISQPTNFKSPRPLSQAASSANLGQRYLNTVSSNSTTAVNEITRNNPNQSSYISAVARQRRGSFKENISSQYDTFKAISVDSLPKSSEKDTSRALKTRSSVPNLTARIKRHSMFSNENISPSFLSMLADTPTTNNQIPSTIDEIETDTDEFENGRLSSTFENYTFALKELSKFNSDFDLTFDDDFSESILKDLNKIGKEDYLTPRTLRRTISNLNLNKTKKNSEDYKKSIELEILQQEEILKKLQDNHNLELEADQIPTHSEISSLDSSTSDNSITNSSITTISTNKSKVSMKLIQNAIFIGIEDEDSIKDEFFRINDKKFDLSLNFEKIIMDGNNDGDDDDDDDFHLLNDLDKTTEIEYENMDDSFDPEVSWSSTNIESLII